ncbi:MAG: PAS domain S-box protein [Syntrophaceae bacterium]
MKYLSRTNQELLEENSFLKQRIQELEQAEVDRKQAEEALRASELRYQTIFETTGTIMLIIEEDMTISLANDGFESLTGYKREEVEGKRKWTEFIKKDDLEKMIARHQLRRAEPGIVQKSYEFRLVHRDGNLKNILLTVDLIPGTKRSVASLMDITDRKQAEEALRESERKYRQLFMNAPATIFEVDYRNRCFISFNEITPTLTGYSREELMQMDPWELFTEESRKTYLERIKLMKEGMDVSASQEYEIRKKDGGILSVIMNIDYTIEDGLPVRARIVSHDITDRKRAEKALKESEQKLANIIDFLPDATFVIDQDKKVVAWNRAMEEMAGVKKEDMIGQGNYVGSVPFYGERRPYLLELIDASDKELESKYEYVHKKGNILYAEGFTPALYGGKGAYLWATGAPLIDGSGNHIGAIESIRDITNRKLAEEELVWKTAFLEAQVEATIDGILVVDGKGKKILANQNLLNIWKVPQHIRDDKDDASLLQYVNSITKYPEQFLEKVMYLYEHPNETSRDEIEFKDGMVLDRYSSPVLGKDGMYYGRIWTFRDITTRKRAEEALRRSEEYFRTITENASDVLFTVDERGIITYVSPSVEHVVGYSPDELIGMSTFNLFIPDDLPRAIYDFSQALLTKDVAISNSFRIRHKDGTELIMEGIGKNLMHNPAIASFVINVRDVTEKKRAEEKFRESQQRLSDIIEFLPDATIVIDNEGKVIAWNRSVEIMTGIKKENMIGKDNCEYALPFYGDRRPILIDLALHPDREMEKQYTAIQRVGDILFGESFTPNLPTGDIHLSATASVLRNSKGEIIAAIECIRDNTERKRLEERLNRAEKMEILGRLAGGVAHDLNNVLGVLVGYSELLAEKLPVEGHLKRYANNIHQSSLRGAAIIQDLLTLARRGVNVSEVVDLNQVVFNYLRTPEFEKLKSYHPDVKVWSDLEDRLLNIKGSPIHLSKTIMNLVSNAVEAITDQGEVTIRTENRYLDCPLRGYDEIQEGDYVVLTVSDTGSGISADDISKIFEPFYTKKVMGRSGTGLGLAVVWGTVKDHNGYIDVQSEEGKGSYFSLYFPATREGLAEVQESISIKAYMGRGESILIVDDVDAQREVAMSMLERLGYKVDAVSSGGNAIEYLKSGKADLVLLDMIMEPGIDGMETYRRILEINPGQKAVIVSGFSESNRVRKAKEMGAGAFVRKPYILEKIGLAIRKELDRK